MSKHTRVSHPIYGLLPMEVEGFDSLAQLALDLRWSWNHATDHVWRRLDPELWELTHNPGSCCRRSRATGSSACWPTPSFAPRWMTWCRAGGTRRRRPRGFSRPTRPGP